MPKSTQLARGVTVREKRGWYHIRFRDPSKSPSRKEVALNTDDLSIAMERARDKLRRYDLGTYDPWKEKDRDLTLKEAVKAYKRDRKGQIRERSIDTVTYCVKQMGKSLPGYVTLRSLSPTEVKNFVYRPKVKQATKNSYWRKLNIFFNWCEDKGYLEDNPLDEVDKPRMPQAVPKYFTEEELDRLLTGVRLAYEKRRKHIHQDFAHPLWARDVYDLAARAGLRRAETQRLRWGDIIWPETNEIGKVVKPGGIVVRSHGHARTKNDRDRVVTMIPGAAERLRYLEREWRKTSDSREPVLKNIHGKGPISAEYASRRFSQYCEFAGLENITFHGLRHTFAAMCRLRGMELYQLKEEMGHSDIQQTLKYGHISPQHRAQATYKLFAE